MVTTSTPPFVSKGNQDKMASGSYYGEYMRSMAQLKHHGDRSAKQVLMDRNAYISFLEAQLERVSAACLTTQTFEKRLAEIESQQLSNEQKLSSLSKVFRLNQEYMEQTSEQSRAEMNAFESKLDGWMDKCSTDIQMHEARLTQCAEQLRRCDAYLEKVSDQTQQEVESVRITLDREVEDLKTLVFAAETRLETMQTVQQDTTQQVEALQVLVTDRVDTDLDRIRASISEKHLAMDRAHEQLRESLKSIASELETSWKVDVARVSRSFEERAEDLRDQLDRLEREQAAEVNELKDILRKCLDSQHLISATVVGLQNEIDHTQSVRPTGGKWSSIEAAIQELRENQHSFQSALTLSQSCFQDTDHRSEERYEQLSERLERSEHKFSRLTREFLSSTDQMQSKLLEAIDTAEQKLKEEADSVVQDAIHSFQIESRRTQTHLSVNFSRLEHHVEELESAILEVKSGYSIPKQERGPAEDARCPVDDISNPVESHDIKLITECVARNLEDQLRSVLNSMQREASDQSVKEAALSEHVQSLEKRLHMNTLREEEHRALFPSKLHGNRSYNGTSEKRSSLRSASSSSSKSSSQSKCAGATKPKSNVVSKRKESSVVSKQPNGTLSTAKAKRLKEVSSNLFLQYMEKMLDFVVVSVNQFVLYELLLQTCTLSSIPLALFLMLPPSIEILVSITHKVDHPN
ncbi:hypothetical protein Poli38472_009795 [Pythium oligandrum]|uniref:Uncharacterized protein n=1 Tax=Pythium oligandrum TaxID=41045 RepID=A0A8K1CFD1_PYTOL|nr:hypothetical protein Poli38472_009795 [Pythium oligandrum]|eukprot:TMW62302.1 hypothetical protein Poli38472_009795 [Pythium oligandrum]